MHVRISPALAAFVAALALGAATPTAAAPVAVPALVATSVKPDQGVVRLAGRWQRHPRRHKRYTLPPDIFRPRCWVNRWGHIHCPYERRLSHWERRNCRVDRTGRLLCRY